MKILSFLFLFAVAAAASVYGQRADSRSLLGEIRSGMIDAYSHAETYYDRGIMRSVLVQGTRPFRPDEEAPYHVVQRRTVLFETAHRAPGEFRFMTTMVGGVNRTKVFSGRNGSFEVHTDSRFTSFQRNDFLSELDREVSFYDVPGNDVARRILGEWSAPPMMTEGAFVEEVGYNGRPAYRLVDRLGLDIVTWWVDRETMLLLATEKVRMRGPAEMVIMTTVYQAERDVRLSASLFTSPGTSLTYDEAEWNLPPLDVPGTVKRVDWMRNVDRGNWAGSPPAQKAPGSSNDQLEAEEPAQVQRGPIEQHLSPDEMAAIVLIEGETGQGTGFITRINDISFVVTNLHVLADAKQLRIRNSRGQTLSAQSIHGARGHDVALIRISEVEAGLKIAEDTSSSRIGDPVVVVGNRLGGGVLTQESGQILGIGPDRIEVDARFQPGNSGSPIINTRTGEVIGIATYLQEVSIMGGQRAVDSSGRPSREVTTRWFGYRFDSVREWERLDWGEWRRQQALVQSFRTNSDVLFGLLRGDRDVYMSDPAFRRIVERFEREIGASRIGQDEYARRAREFVNDLINFSRNDLRTLDGQFYDYFRSSDYFETSIPLQLQFRQQLTEYLQERERDYRHFRQMLGR